MTTPAEKRRTSRFPLDVRVSIIANRRGALTRSQVRAVELSEGGMAISSPLELPTGDAVEVEFALPGVRTMLRIKALVRYKRLSRYGLEFTSLTEGQRKEVRACGEFLKAQRTQLAGAARN